MPPATFQRMVNKVIAGLEGCQGDHNPLVFLNRLKNKNQRLLCWSLTLQDYNLDIRHIPGRDNVIADALSRQHRLA